MTDKLWRQLHTEATAFLDRPVAEVEIRGDAVLPSRLPVMPTAIGCIGAALSAAAGLYELRTGARPRARLDAAHAAAAVRSEAWLRVAGQPMDSGFAPLSRFWRAADGWVRTHANYPWHREALLRCLGASDDVNAVTWAIGERSATDIETAVVDAGGIAVAVRSSDQWRHHPQGRAAAACPLVDIARTGDATPRPRSGADLPASGLRVLDLTRVIAGPVATRYLASLGADVLRLDPPSLPELPLQVYDALPGKRSALLDAGSSGGLERLHALLDAADVLVHGYRPGALDAFGLDDASLAHRHPGLVSVTLSAWGRTGPWGQRRGFDSIVQAASGIALVESPDGERPGALPCQLLDHGTGYLAAAAALEGVRRQAASGGSYRAGVSLAATAAWLLRQPRATEAVGVPAEPAAAEWLITLESDRGTVTAVAPPGSLDGMPLRWPARLAAYGQDAPQW